MLWDLEAELARLLLLLLAQFDECLAPFLRDVSELDRIVHVVRVFRCLQREIGFKLL